MSAKKKKSVTKGRPKNENPEPKRGITIFLPLQLSEKLDEVARLNDRSKSQEIIHTLKQVHLPEGVE